MRTKWSCATVALLAVALAGAPGCDDRDNSSSRPDRREATPRRSSGRVTGPTGNGVVKGTVTFKGVAPEPEDVPGAKCHSGAAPTTIAPVVVAADGGLKDVMVSVKDADAEDVAPDAAPAVLDQVNCQYVPHVLGLQVGQALKVLSSDETMHNVHTLSVDNPPVNLGTTGAGQSLSLAFRRPERFAVKCDVHPWMRAHVYVFDHPYFAATAADGRYEIKGLPPGEHTLVFSHPFLGDRERKVTVADDSTTETNVTFEKGK